MVVKSDAARNNRGAEGMSSQFELDLLETTVTRNQRTTLNQPRSPSSKPALIRSWQNIACSRPPRMTRRFCSNLIHGKELEKVVMLNTTSACCHGGE